MRWACTSDSEWGSKTGGRDVTRRLCPASHGSRLDAYLHLALAFLARDLHAHAACGAFQPQVQADGSHAQVLQAQPVHAPGQARRAQGHAPV